MKNKSNVFAFIALVLVLPVALNAFSQQKDGIKISIKDFMNDPYAHVMSGSNWTITAEDLQKHTIAAIKVKVTNNTDKPICIAGRSVKLLQATPEDVAAKFKKREILPPFLFSCLNSIVGTGFVGRIFVQEVTKIIDPFGVIVEKWKLDPQEADFLRDDRYDALLNKHGLDKNNLDLNNPIFNTEEFKEDLREFKDDMNREIINLFRDMASIIGNRSTKTIGFFTLTGIGGSIAYWLYLKNLNNQLVSLLQQSILDEMITIAPNQSIEKVILCDGMLSQDFKFSIFNRGHVPIAEFAVDLSA